ncbi:hypothetical protein JRQ81_004083, partial [Phrynocephalus forsythii]
ALSSFLWTISIFPGCLAPRQLLLCSSCNQSMLMSGSNGRPLCGRVHLASQEQSCGNNMEPAAMQMSVHPICGFGDSAQQRLDSGFPELLSMNTHQTAHLGSLLQIALR